MSSIYEGSVKKPVMTALVFVAVVILGLFSLNKLPIDLLPDIETNTIMVLTTYQGASAADIETNVTRPLENSLNTVANLKKIKSSSRENRSIISLEFEYGLDIEALTNDVRDKLDMVKSYLPEGTTEPIIFKFSTDMIPVMMISATAEQSLPALYKILDENVANPLARISGVGSVSVNGAPEREIQVFVDPSKLEAYHLTIESIAQVIRMENVNTPAGTIDIGNESYSLRVQGEFISPLELNNLVVGSYAGKNVYISDIAVVKDDLEERAQEVYTNAVQGATIVVQKQSGSNTVKIAEEIHKILPELQKNLPSDVKIEPIMDTSDNIKKTISGLVETVMYAFLFVMLVVLVFLGRWRATVIIIVTIPISLISAFIYLGFTGGSLNIISLSSLSVAIGMVVDDAIVVLENITTHIERGSRPKSAAVHGTSEVSISVIASTLTLLAVFFPLTMITGMAGVMFEQLGWMVTIIMIVSTVAALTLTPMMSSQMLKMNPKKGKIYKFFFTPIEKALDYIDVKYADLVNWSVRHRKTVVFSLFGFFVLSLIPARFIGTEFIPAEDNSRIAVTVELPIGTRSERSKEVAETLYKTWRQKYPELDMINFTVGQASSKNVWGSLQNNGSNIISYNIRMIDMNERQRSVFEICDSMRVDLDNMPEIKKSNVLAGGGMGMMGGQSTLDVEIYGYDFFETDQVAAELSKRIAKVPGLVNVKISREDYQPEYRIQFDREKLAMNGLNMATASSFLRNRINGLTASLFREDGEEYNIKVAYAPEFRQSIEALENILIYNSQGQSIRIKDLGKVVEEFSPPTIERKNRQRLITVSSTVSGTTIDKAVAGINKALDSMTIPSNIYTVIAGTYLDQQESFADLSVLLLLIILLVFIVMASQFESLTYPFIIMFSVPFAVSGVILAFFITGVSLNMMSFVGIIMLVGIVVKNGIVLVDYINLNRGRGMGVIQAVINGGKSRLRPVLMTTLTTILGMVPLAVSTSEGSELWKPMAITVIGGLTISTIFTLIIVPTVYAIFAGNGVKRNRKKWRKKLRA
ncbi:MAG: multidrug transporter AcrB [Bacteroidales bacterium 36-12]|jgi:HAE1 family hydrophobic/amphiphilic exporter-1|nr:MAG: multidrug transporter AcrB [Bacteroidales bacterium 36-12]